MGTRAIDWIIVYAPDIDEWQVSDGPVGERGISYDFKTKQEAEHLIMQLRRGKNATKK